MKFLWLIFLAGYLCCAAEPKKDYPTFGEGGEGSIKVLIAGQGVEKEGYYVLSGPSLAAVVKADKPRISPHARDVLVHRESGGQKAEFRVALADLRKTGEFILKDGDVIWIATPIF
jgi:hypothetical protein